MSHDLHPWTWDAHLLRFYRILGRKETGAASSKSRGDRWGGWEPLMLESGLNPLSQPGGPVPFRWLPVPWPLSVPGYNHWVLRGGRNEGKIWACAVHLYLSSPHTQARLKGCLNIIWQPGIDALQIQMFFNPTVAAGEMVVYRGEGKKTMGPYQRIHYYCCDMAFFSSVIFLPFLCTM